MYIIIHSMYAAKFDAIRPTAEGKEGNLYR